MEPEFTLFPQLATELRLQIWKYVAHQKRDVKVAITKKKDKLVSTPNASDKIPGLLHVNSESRQVGLGSYIKILTQSSPSCIYTNPAADILCLRMDDSIDEDVILNEYGNDRSKYGRWHINLKLGLFNTPVGERYEFIVIEESASLYKLGAENKIDEAGVLRRTGWLSDGPASYYTLLRRTMRCSGSGPVESTFTK